MLDFIGRAHAQWSRIDPVRFTNQTVSGYVSLIIEWFLLVAGALVVIYLVYGGILYITAGGDAEKATKGRTAVINAIIGLIIILLAYLITAWVTNAAEGIVG